MATKNLKVVIVGGSISGLSLALMLERNGIDFVVLEGYSKIAPQVGAGISILPNGMRILDQLGCYEAIMKEAQYDIDKVMFHDSNGKPFWTIKNVTKQIVEQHGYPIIFFDRRMLIQILYDKIQDKSKILTSERVETVRSNPDGVVVTTNSGKTFTGDIVVGADGVHSKVRQEMWQEAQARKPEWIDPEEQKLVPTKYVSIFGISEGIDTIEKGTLTSVLNENFSYFIPSGPNDKTYWLLVRNLGDTVYGDIPRFTKDDEAELVKEHWDDQLTPTLKFSDLYKTKTASVYTSLPEYVYKRWYFERIITIGDSCHKFEPLTGQGGNNAIETAASLVNHLVEALNESNQDSGLSTKRISAAFEATQRQREMRASGLVREAHDRQRLECLETGFLKFFAQNIMPRLPESIIHRRWLPTFAPAVSLNMLPQPSQPHAVPFFDELVRQPKSRGKMGSILSVAFLLLAFLASQMLFGASQANGTFGFVRDAILGKPMTEQGVMLRHTFTGFAKIDAKLQALVAIFFPVVTGAAGFESQLQSICFLSAVLPMVAIITIEGFRPRNRWTLLALPSLWGALCQLGGIGLIGPLYFLCSQFTTRHKSHFLSKVPTFSSATAKSFLPALAIGYIIPSMLLFVPIQDHHVRQGIIAWWQPAPVNVAVLVALFSWEIRLVQNRLKFSTVDTKPVSHVANTYLVTGIMAACVHMTTILTCFISKSLSVSSVFLPQEDSFAPKQTLGAGSFAFLQNDFILFTISALLWGIMNIWDMHRMGLSKSSPYLSAIAMAISSVVVGPGAALAAVWYWREHLIHDVHDRKTADREPQPAASKDVKAGC